MRWKPPCAKRNPLLARLLSRSLSLTVLSLALGLCAKRTPAQGLQANLLAADPPANSVWLGSLDLSKMVQLVGRPQADRSFQGNPLRLRKVVYAHGVGCHAACELRLDLHRKAVRFVSRVGVDDETRWLGYVRFYAWVDGRRAAMTPILQGDGETTLLDVDLRGAQTLDLRVLNPDGRWKYDHADFAGAYITLLPGAPAPTPITIPGALPAAVTARTVNAIHGPILWLLPTAAVGLALAIVGSIVMRIRSVRT